jgi:hypothetical protein
MQAEASADILRLLDEGRVPEARERLEALTDDGEHDELEEAPLLGRLRIWLLERPFWPGSAARRLAGRDPHRFNPESKGTFRSTILGPQQAADRLCPIRYQYQAASRGWTYGVASTFPRLIAAFARWRSFLVYMFLNQRGGTPSHVRPLVLAFQRLIRPPGRTFHLL